MGSINQTIKQATFSPEGSSFGVVLSLTDRLFTLATFLGGLFILSTKTGTIKQATVATKSSHYGFRVQHHFLLFGS